MSAAHRFNRRRKTVSARFARALAAAAYSVRGNPALALPLVIVLCAVATLMACARPAPPAIGEARAAPSAASLTPH
jgi:hypothetical protein